MAVYINKTMRIHLEKKLEPYKIIEILFKNGWSSKAYKYFDVYDFNENAWINKESIINDDEFTFLDNMQTSFDKFQQISLDLYNESLNLTLNIELYNKTYIEIPEEEIHKNYVSIIEQDDDKNYSIIPVENIISIDMNYSILNYPYGKTTYWEYYEGLLIPDLIEEGIGIKKVEFEHIIEDYYHYYKFKHYSKESNTWKIKEETHVDIKNYSVEIDGLKIKQKEDLINEIGFMQISTGRPYKKIDHITWNNLEYSKKEMASDFDEVMEFFKSGETVLDEKTESGEIIRIYEKYPELPIKKIKNKDNLFDISTLKPKKIEEVENIEPKKEIKEEKNINNDFNYFSFLHKYAEHIIIFIKMQEIEDYAPISAYETINGDIIGYLYIGSEYNTYTVTSNEVIKRMEGRFEKELKNNEIKSYVIMYHSQFENDENHKLATSQDKLKAISIMYNSLNNSKGKVALPYTFKKSGVIYKGFDELTKEENEVILNTSLMPEKDYFQDKEELKEDILINEAEIEIVSIDQGAQGDNFGALLGLLYSIVYVIINFRWITCDNY